MVDNVASVLTSYGGNTKPSEAALLSMGAGEEQQVPPAAEDGNLGELPAAFRPERDANVKAAQYSGPTGRTGLDALLLALKPNRLQQPPEGDIEAGRPGDNF